MLIEIVSDMNYTLVFFLCAFLCAIFFITNINCYYDEEGIKLLVRKNMVIVKTKLGCKNVMLFCEKSTFAV